MWAWIHDASRGVTEAQKLWHLSSGTSSECGLVSYKTMGRNRAVTAATIITTANKEMLGWTSIIHDQLTDNICSSASLLMSHMSKSDDEDASVCCQRRRKKAKRSESIHLVDAVSRLNILFSSTTISVSDFEEVRNQIKIFIHGGNIWIQAVWRITGSDRLSTEDFSVTL